MKPWLWLVWVAVVFFLTSGFLEWHLNYFKSPGPQFYKAALIMAPVLSLAVFGYAWLRRSLVWRYEPAAFIVITGVAMLCFEPRAFLAGLALFLASYAVGGFAAGKLGLILAGPGERLVVQFGIGCGLLIPTLFVLGELSLLKRGVFFCVLLIPIVGLFREGADSISDLRTLNRRWSESPDLRHPMVGIGVAFGWIATLCALMIALTPSITFDALNVHLPSAQHYVATHSVSPFSEIPYSYFPQGAELLWTLTYGLAGPAGMQIVSLVFFVLFLLVLFQLARACGCGPVAAVVGTLWAGTLPFLHWTGSVIKNDMIMAFFQALALYAFLRWLEGREFLWIVTGVFFMAQSFGVKHVALFGAVPLAMFFGYAVWKQPRRWKAAATVTLVFLLFGTFWTVRTYILTGDPAYPEPTKRAVGNAESAHGSKPLGRVARYVKLPFTIVLNGKDTFESPLRNPAGIILFAFFPLIWFALGRGRKAAMICLAFVFLYLAYWSTILSALRYAIVPFAILAVLLAQGTTLFFEAEGAKLVRGSILVLQVYCMLIAALGTMIVEINGPQIAYFSGRLDKPGYLRTVLRTYGSLEYLQGVAKPGSVTLGIDNCSRAYAPNPIQFQCTLCPPSGCSPLAVAEDIKRYGPEYVIAPEQGSPMELPGGTTQNSWIQIYHDAFFGVYQRR